MASSTSFTLLAGHPALDLLNTVSWRLSEEPGEQLHSFAELVAWARKAGLIDAAERRALEDSARRAPKPAEKVLSLALELRELGYLLVEALLEGKRPHATHLKRLNAFASRPGSRATLGWEDKGYVWTLDRPAGDPDRLLRQLIQTLTEFLTSPDSRRVAQCQDDRGCGWVFLDRSRSRVRRWCSMADCGNRAKARRHYQRNVGG